MLTRLLKNNRISGVIILAVLTVILWFRQFYLEVPASDLTGMPLYELIFSIFENHKTAIVLFSLVYIGFNGMLLNRLNLVHYLLEGRSFMPAAFFIMLCATFPSTQVINPVFIASPFFIMSLVVIIKGEEHQADPMAIFNAGLVIAAGSFFYLKILWFLPFLWITAAVIRPLGWRGLLKPFIVIGILSSFYITYYWVFKDNLNLLANLVNEELSISLAPEKFDINQWILIAYLVLLIMISSLYMLNRFQAKKIIIRKLYLVFFFLFGYSLLFYILISGFKTQALTLLFIPVSYLYANYFNQQKNIWIHESLLWIWIVLLTLTRLNLFF